MSAVGEAEQAQKKGEDDTADEGGAERRLMHHRLCDAWRLARRRRRLCERKGEINLVRGALPEPHLPRVGRDLRNGRPSSMLPRE